MAVSNPADDWIARTCPGRSFADIGGLWGLVNEKASVAMRAGAAAVTMIDILPQTNQLWADFLARLVRLGVPPCACATLDATRQDFPRSAGAFDVVHCSGILYHLPSPMCLIENLWSITGEILILTAMTSPDRIENDAGVLDLSGGLAAYIPGLSGKAAAVVRRHFELLDLHVHAITADMGQRWYAGSIANFTPWWWIVTPSLLRSMVETIGFEVLDMFEPWKHRSTAVVCRKPAKLARPAP